MKRWLADTFGESRASVTFVPKLLRLIAQVRQRLGALRLLAAKLPSSFPDSAARMKFDRQVRTTYSALRGTLDALDVHVAVLFGSTARKLPIAAPPDDWRARTEAAVPYAATLDRLVQDLLTHDDLPSNETDTAGIEDCIRHTFNNLWDVVNAQPPQPVTTP